MKLIVSIPGKLLFSVIFLGVAQLAALAQPALSESQLALYPPDIAAIMRKGELVVAICSVDDSPYFYVNAKGELTGRDVEFARMIAKRIGVRAVFDRTSPTFDGVVERVFERQADIGMGDLECTSSRSLKVSFTDPYKTAASCLLVNRLLMAKNGWQTDVIARLAGADQSVKIGVVAHSSNVDRTAEEFPHATMVQYDSSEKLLRDVVDGKIFASETGDSHTWLRDWLQTHPGAAFRAVEIDTKHVEGAGIAVAWPNSSLRNFLNMYIWELAHDGTLDTWPD